MLLLKQKRLSYQFSLSSALSLGEFVPTNVSPGIPTSGISQSPSIGSMSKSRVADRPNISRPHQAPTDPPITPHVMEDDDSEECEAAQWWYTFWSSSLATIATVCDLTRAIFTGPAIMLYKYLFTHADIGILVRRPVGRDSTFSPDLHRDEHRRSVYRCALFSLVKLSRIRKVTKASYTEIILSLLAGGLRAYHQVGVVCSSTLVVGAGFILCYYLTVWMILSVDGA